MSPKNSDSRLRSSLVALLIAPSALLAACGDEVVNNFYTYGEGGADSGQGAAPNSNAGKTSVGGKTAIPSEGGTGTSEGGTPSEDPVAGAGGEATPVDADPNYPDAPLSDTAIADQDLDVFGVVGNKYWFAVNEEQLARMNQNGGCCGGPGPGNGDIYQPGGGGGDAAWVDHLWVTTAGDAPQTSHYGKVQVKVVGQSTWRPWEKSSIPNLNIDSNQFVKNQRIGGYEHLRFGNSQVGNIFRERLTLQLFNLLGYPAPLATHAWVQSNVWGADISIPYTLVERYKREFCARNADLIGGGCANMWEYVGDFNVNYGGGGPKGGGFGGDIIGPGPIPNQWSMFDQPENCQVDQCDATRVKQLEAKFGEVPPGDGFKAGLADWIAWPEFHKFQCLEWILGVGDDTIHNGGNNSVLIERTDGKFQFLPYSVDISLGQDWYSFVRLAGDGNYVARGCQADSECWADTIATCEGLLDDFAGLDPNQLLKNEYDELKAAGMLRPGDDDRYQALDAYLTSRLENLPIELEDYRDNPYGNYCQYPMVDCGGYCDYPEYCPQQCVPPGEPLPDPMPGVGGAPAGGGMMPPPIDVGGMVGVAGTVGIGGDIGVGGGVAGGGGLPECPKIENYGIAR